MNTIKLSDKELQILNELQTKGNQLIFTLGQIEAQKTSIFNQIQEVQNQNDEIGKELQKKYGDGNINLETGEFTKTE